MTKTRSIHRSRRLAAMPQNTVRLVRQAVIDALIRAGLAGDPGQPLRVARAATALAPVQMAATQTADPDECAALVASYERLLEGYRHMVQAEGDADDDVGRAVAFFVAANLHALHGVDADVDLLVPLEGQLRGVARVRSNWDAAATAERQTFFERIAILSMAITAARASAATQGAATQGAAALADVRRTAREYLEQLLGLDPELLTLGPDGLVARHAPSVPAVAHCA